MWTIFISIVVATMSISATTAQREPPRFAALSSGQCQNVGMRPIYTLRECTEAARSLNFRWDWQVDRESNYRDQPDGCSVRDERSVTGRHALFVQQKGACRVGASSPSWIPELNGRATCMCSRFSPCICGVDSLIAHCPGGKFGHTKVYDYDGNVVDSRKYCIP